MLTLFLIALGIVVGFVARRAGETAEIGTLSRTTTERVCVGFGAFLALILFGLAGLIGVIAGYFLYPYLPAKYRG